ncbi:MAG: tRNA (guanosine(46)-N7)-methyltransferase TrmB [Thermoanaerobaculia bacterium]|nr:tRNA (guanosine(46)-N7)-methyltransferase TrmB [Thermoanaerobaculia bacterium]
MSARRGVFQPVRVVCGEGDCGLGRLPAPLPLDRLAGGRGPWEVELGFGKGRYLLSRAAGDPDRRFLGIERAGSYLGLAARRARRRDLVNVVLLRGDALYLLSAVLPRGFAAAVHVYFPDPWPKSRHEKRRLLDPGSIDLVVGLLGPGGRLYFATDFLSYGASVRELLEGTPGVRVREHEGEWEEGPRTNYEAKYAREGRPICRLVADFEPRGEPLHPLGRAAVLAATAPRETP